MIRYMVVDIEATEQAKVPYEIAYVVLNEKGETLAMKDFFFEKHFLSDKKFYDYVPGEFTRRFEDYTEELIAEIEKDFTSVDLVLMFDDNYDKKMLKAAGIKICAPIKDLRKAALKNICDAEYISWTTECGRVTKKGNPRTDMESVYGFLCKTPGFSAVHMSRYDIIHESFILKCLLEDGVDLFKESSYRAALQYVEPRTDGETAFAIVEVKAVGKNPTPYEISYSFLNRKGEVLGRKGYLSVKHTQGKTLKGDYEEAFTQVNFTKEVIKAIKKELSTVPLILTSISGEGLNRLSQCVGGSPERIKNLMEVAYKTICKSEEYQEWTEKNKKLTAEGSPRVDGETLMRFLYDDSSLKLGRRALDKVFLEEILVRRLLSEVNFFDGDIYRTKKESGKRKGKIWKNNRSAMQ